MSPLKVNLSNDLLQQIEGKQTFQSLLLNKSSTGSLSTYYKEATGGESLLGEGGFGSVRKMIHKSTGRVRAVKKIEITTENVQMLSAELSILLQLDHPNVLKVFEWYQGTGDDENALYIVTEICTGGEMQDLVLAGTPQQRVEGLLLQIFSAVQYCHAMGVVHRDLKLENCLLKEKVQRDADGKLLTEGDHMQLKVIDFGLAAVKSKAARHRGSEHGGGEERLSEVLGTPFYIAPEVLTGDYNEKCDVWACGIMMYMLLTGEHPFAVEADLQRRSPKKLFHKIKTKEPNMEFLKGVHPDAKDLILKLLAKKPQERPSAREALQHPWCQSIRRQTGGASGPNLKSLRNIRNYCHSSKLEQVLRTIAAREANHQDLASLRQAFQEVDLDGSGTLSKDEVHALLRDKMGETVDDATFNNLWATLDCDESGVIGYTEFLSAVVDKSIYAQDEIIQRAFEYFDLDNSGSIDRDELALVLGADEVDEVMAKLDLDGSGKISRNEFRDFIKQLAGVLQQEKQRRSAPGQLERNRTNGSSTTSSASTGSTVSSKGNGKGKTLGAARSAIFNHKMISRRLSRGDLNDVMVGDSD